MKWPVKGLCEYESYILDVCLFRHDKHFHYPLQKLSLQILMFAFQKINIGTRLF